MFTDLTLHLGWLTILSHDGCYVVDFILTLYYKHVNIVYNMNMNMNMNNTVLHGSM